MPSLGSLLNPRDPNEAKQGKLLDLQIADVLQTRADDAYKQSPEYLNLIAQGTSNQGRREYGTAKSSALTTGQNNIKNAFKELGEPGLAAPYLALLQKDAEGLDYHQGAPAEAHTSNSVGAFTMDNFNEQQYLAANPDVAAGVADGRFVSGAQHFQLFGQQEGRQGAQLSNTTVSPVGQDWWDDPSSLATKDYGVSDAINTIRTGRKNTAFDTAKGTATSRLGAMGLDDATTAQLSGLVGNKFQSIYDTAGTSANDYSGVFDADAVLNSVLGTERTGRRGGYSTAVNAAFNGVDPTTDFADTADDQYINDIVGRQYTDATSALERAKARGSLTNTGYSSGLAYLGDQRNTAMSTAQTLGGAVLARDRGELSGIKSKAATDAGAWDFGQTFDPNKYLTDYTNKKTALSEGLGGEISNALAGQNWFNVGDVLTKAGYAQGAQNVKPLQSGFDTPALAALGDERKKNSAAGRGLGGTGVF